MKKKVSTWNKSERACLCCTTKFYPEEEDQVYCSSACKPVKIWDVSLRRCAWCDTAYRPAASNQKYCSKRCGQEANVAGLAVSRFPILNRDGFTCFYCGRSSYKHGIELHIDHVVPVSRGGLDIASNLVTSCAECNLGKFNNEIFDPAPLLEELSQRNERFGISPDQIIKKVVDQIPVNGHF